jgi:hypothetical protein
MITDRKMRELQYWRALQAICANSGPSFFQASGMLGFPNVIVDFSHLPAFVSVAGKHSAGGLSPCMIIPKKYALWGRVGKLSTIVG